MLVDPKINIQEYVEKSNQTIPTRYINEEGISSIECYLEDPEDLKGWHTLYAFRRLEEGVYESDLNFDNFLEDAGKKIVRYQYQFLQKKGYNYVENKEKWYEGVNLYPFEFFGVGDSPEQILSRPWIKRQFVDSPDKFVLSITSIRKEDQPSRGGWRWHKWGTYIGEKNPRHEYLYDETDIEEVYVFHFYYLEE